MANYFKTRKEIRNRKEEMNKIATPITKALLIIFLEIRILH